VLGAPHAVALTGARRRPDDQSAVSVSPLAAWLMVPYLAWVLFAKSLTAGAVALN
jgi:hypothetical protein